MTDTRNPAGMTPEQLATRIATAEADYYEARTLTTARLARARLDNLRRLQRALAVQEATHDNA